MLPCWFADNYESGFRSTLRFLYSRGVPPEAAEDLAQEAWTRAWEVQNQLRDPARLISWVNTIALRLYLNVQRQSRRIHRLDDFVLTNSEPSTALAVSLDFDRLLSRVSGRDRALLLLYYAGGKGIDEAARLLGISPLAARVRLCRCRSRLRAWARR